METSPSGKPLANPDLKQTIKSSLLVGAITGGAGLVTGFGFGLVRSKHPFVHAIAAGINYFGLGSIFWATRTTLTTQTSFKSESNYASSAAAGTFSGGLMAALTKTRRHVVPQAILTTLIVTSGQGLYNAVTASQDVAVDQPSDGTRPKTLLERIASSRFSPITVLDDATYEKLLQEKLLRVEADIAILDEDMERLKADDKKQID